MFPEANPSDPIDAEFLRMARVLYESEPREVHDAMLRLYKPQTIEIHASIFKNCSPENWKDYLDMGGFQTPGGISDFDITV